MPDDVDLSATEAREAATFATLMGAAHARQAAAMGQAAPTPRFLLDGARSMAMHLGMTAERMQDQLAPMALWQLHLPSELGKRQWDFDAVRAEMPASYEIVRRALAMLDAQPQLVTTVFHMPAFPILCTLIGAAWRAMHDGPLHALIASRNMGWLRLGNNRWILDAISPIGTDPAGLRTLMAGLRNGSIRRLLILADGPQAPGLAGIRALDGISPALGIRTTLLSKIRTLGIPILPITHEWTGDRLTVRPRPVLDGSDAAAIDAVVRLVEELLRRHPEQWLNWSAARIRT